MNRRLEEALRAAGIAPRHTNPGNQRLPHEGCSKRANASLTIHPDGSGCFQCFKCGVSGGSCADPWGNRYDVADARQTYSKSALRSAAIRQRINEQQAEKDARHAEAAQEAVRIWTSSQYAPPAHPYAVRKKLDVAGLKYAERFMSLRCALLVRMLDQHGSVVNLQGIDPHGEKRFLRGARVRGVFSLIGIWRKDFPPARIAIAEGYATAAAFVKLHPEFRGVAAMSAQNLLATAQIMRDKFPHVPITIAADRDLTGAREAGSAAMEVQADIIFPDHGKDFVDDLEVSHG